MLDPDIQGMLFYLGVAILAGSGITAIVASVRSHFARPHGDGGRTDRDLGADDLPTIDF